MCGSGKVDSRAVNAISKAVMVTWAELMVRGKRAPIRGESPVEATCQPGQEAEPPLDTRPARKQKRRDQSRVARASTVEDVQGASSDVRRSPLDGQAQPLNEPSNGQNKAEETPKASPAVQNEESQISDSPETRGLKELDARESDSCSASTPGEALQAASKKVSNGDFSIPKRALAGAVSPGSPFGETARDPEPGGNNRGKNETQLGEWAADHKGEEAALVGSRIWSVAEAIESITQELRRRTTISSQLRL